MRGKRRRLHPELEWREAKERDLLERHVPGVLLAIAVIETFMALRNALVLTWPAQIILPALQAVIVVFALFGWWRVRRDQVSSETLQKGIGVGVVGLGLLLPLEQALTGNGLLSANLGLLIVAAGAATLSHRVFGVTVGVLIAAWLLAVTTRSTWDPPVDKQAALIAIATFLGVLIHWNRTNDRTALTRQLQETMEGGLRDELTGLWNRRGGREVWEVLVVGARQEGATVWCIFLDVRGLKGVNDRLGHASGDKLLVGIAGVLVESVTSEVVATRWGGDEFCLFGAGPPPDAEALAGAIRRNAERTIGAIDQPWDVSPGVSVMPAESGDAAFWRLVDGADEDMYRRRGAGGPVTRSR